MYQPAEGIAQPVSDSCESKLFISHTVGYLYQFVDVFHFYCLLSVQNVLYHLLQAHTGSPLTPPPAHTDSDFNISSLTPMNSLQIWSSVFQINPSNRHCFRGVQNSHWCNTLYAKTHTRACTQNDMFICAAHILGRPTDS